MKMASFQIFVGIFALTAVNNVSLIWGNLSLYTTSYFYFRVHEEVALDTSWVVAANTAAWSIGLMLCAKITDMIGCRNAIAAGVILYTGTMFLCVLAVQRSFLVFIFAFGLACGFATGVLQGQQLLLVTKWCQTQFLGLGCGGILAFQQIGSVVMNVAITYYINPNNSIPNTSKLFSQPEILGKVPNVFIIYGAVALVLGIISFVLVKEKSKQACRGVDEAKRKNGIEIEVCTSSINTENSLKDEVVTSNSQVAAYNKNHEISSISSTKSECISSTVSETTYLKHNQDIEKAEGVKATEKSDGVKKETPDVSPKQALKTMTFYSLVVLTVHTDITFIILNTYYKMFGMLYYPDDHFFTITSVVLNGGSCIALGLAGIMCDKFRLKNVIIANSCLLCLLSGSFNLTARVDKLLYSMCVVFCAGSVFGNYLMATIGMVQYFGISHSTTVYGMAMSVSVVTNTVTPPFIHYVLSTYGWLTIYTSVGVINLIGIIVVVTGLPVLASN